MRGPKEGPAAWIGAGAAVVAIPVAIVLGLLSINSGQPAARPTGGAESGTVRAPGSSEPKATGELCVREDGGPVGCSAADAWLVVPASHCDAGAMSRALGADPDTIELQVETKNIAGQCAVAPSAAARRAGATIGDLTNLRHGVVPARVLTCWQEANPGTAVPCSQPHHFEPASQWRPLGDQAEPESVCPGVVRAYVAGQADSPAGALSTMWVISQEQEPRYRCLVKSRDSLTGTVYRLSGRPLPTPR